MTDQTAETDGTAVDLAATLLRPIFQAADGVESAVETLHGTFKDALREVTRLTALVEQIEALCDAAEYVVLAVDDPGLPPVKAVAETDLRAAIADVVSRPGQPSIPPAESDRLK